jgi:hypothetical protein
MLRRDLRFVGMPEDNEAPPKISVQFTCPACGGHNLDVESADVLGCQPVKGLDEEGNLVLDWPKFYTDESHFYLSCPDCGYEPDVDLDDLDPEGNLVKWLKEHVDVHDSKKRMKEPEHE